MVDTRPDRKTLGLRALPAASGRTERRTLRLRETLTPHIMWSVQLRGNPNHEWQAGTLRREVREFKECFACHPSPITRHATNEVRRRFCVRDRDSIHAIRRSMESAPNHVRSSGRLSTRA
jgi:hypothetical protein